MIRQPTQKEIEEVLMKHAEIKEAFLLEELQPFFIRDGDELIMNQQLRLRLKEIEDVKKECQEKHNKFIEKLKEEFCEKKYDKDYCTENYPCENCRTIDKLSSENLE